MRYPPAQRRHPNARPRSLGRRALQAHHPLHGRRRRPRRQGHALHRHPRRRGPGGARRLLRRARRRRADLPRHHGDLRQARRPWSSWRAARPTRCSSRSRSAAACAPVDDAQAVLDAGADKVSVNSAAVARPGRCSRRWRACSATSASCSRWTRGAARTAPGRSSSPAAARRPGATRSRGCARASSAGRGRSC